jgi:hypothetical protein
LLGQALGTALVLRRLLRDFGKADLLHRSTQAILRTFVAPGVPNGTPAVMTTR